MLPKYPFIIHLSIVSRDVESLQLSPSQGSLLLFVQPKEQRRQLATKCCGCSQRSPPGRWEGACSGGSSIQAACGSWPRGSTSFYLPAQVFFCVARQRQTMATSCLLEVTSRRKSIKLAFENSAIELPATPRTWPESTFCQPQEAIVFFFKKLSAWRETTKWEGNCLPKES